MEAGSKVAVWARFGLGAAAECLTRQIASQHSSSDAIPVSLNDDYFLDNNHFNPLIPLQLTLFTPLSLYLYLILLLFWLFSRPLLT